MFITAAVVILFRSSALQLETWWIVAWFLAIAWFVPSLCDGWFTSIENFFSKLASKRSACILILFFATIAIRLLLLPVVPYPRPIVHDEYSYLLQADIFVHGRLAFPPHPMARYFETFYVNFHPTYSSMYPPAQSAALALGQLLGNPWIGVLLSTAAMVAVILWMLQGWFSPRWAFLGAVLVLIRLAIFSYWMNSYWGGSVAAIGAALVLGALPRLKRAQTPCSALLLGIGIFILANSRPLEGFMFCIPVAVILFCWLFRLRALQQPIPIRRVLFPIFACLFGTVVFTLYYNWRLTGDFFTMPRTLYYRQYVSVSPFIWGRILAPFHYANPQFDAFFNGWMRTQYDGTWLDLKRIEWLRLAVFWKFFLGALLAAPFLSSPWLLKDRRLRPVLWHFSFCVLGLSAVRWFYPHYAAPAMCVFLVILVQSFRRLRRWECGGRPVGLGWLRTIVIPTFLMLPLCIIDHIRRPNDELCFSLRYNWERASVVSELEKMAGEHIVIVRYSAAHDVNVDWVSNSADIDRSKIIWAREIPGEDLSPLLAYYTNRKAWLVEADSTPARLYPYPQTFGSSARLTSKESRSPRHGP
jgi:hypothetical protein